MTATDIINAQKKFGDDIKHLFGRIAEKHAEDMRKYMLKKLVEKRLHDSKTPA
jgi:hypothetical protein